MASLLHIVDTDSLEKDPNLKFDPQNASAFLNNDHPKFQELKEGLTPEQIEILENVTQVDGFELKDHDEKILNGDEEFIDPDTGEKIKLDDTDLTLDDLGFVDPSKLRTLTLEAFYHFEAYELQQKISGAYGELSTLSKELARTGYVSRLQADNINGLLGGGLYDNVVMESFTKLPTKTNFNLVMEEVDHAKAALAAGAGVVGAAVLYKLIKWFLNSWNKNAVASGSIAGNIKNMQERAERLKNSTDIINTANTALAQTIQDLKNSGELNNSLKPFLTKLQGMQNVSDQNQAMQLMGELEKAVSIKALKPYYSNMWLSISTGQQVQVGSGSFIANQAFFAAIPLVIGACKELQNIVNSQVENIRTTGADKAIQDKDTEYKKALDSFKQFGGIVGYTQQSDNVFEYCNGMMNHILQNIVAPLSDSFIIKDVPNAQKMQVVNAEAWNNVDDDYEKEVSDFQESITSLNGKEGKAGVFGIGAKAAQPDKVQQGNDVQKDSRIAEYEKITQAFRGSMCVMRALLAVRNNLGKGLSALNKETEKLYGGK